MTNLNNNTAQNRFEIEVNGYIAFASYSLDENVVIIPHVFTPPELCGQGVAGNLMKQIAEYLRANNLKLQAICPYAVAWLAKNKDYSDIEA